MRMPFRSVSRRRDAATCRRRRMILCIEVLAGMMALLIWGRLRYDLVAVLALLAAVFVGIIPYNKAFSGFSDDIVIIVASALIVSAAVARSGAMEMALKKIAPHVT